MQSIIIKTREEQTPRRKARSDGWLAPSTDLLPTLANFWSHAIQAVGGPIHDWWCAFYCTGSVFEIVVMKPLQMVLHGGSKSDSMLYFKYFWQHQNQITLLIQKEIMQRNADRNHDRASSMFYRWLQTQSRSFLLILSLDSSLHKPVATGFPRSDLRWTFLNNMAFTYCFQVATVRTLCRLRQEVFYQ